MEKSQQSKANIGPGQMRRQSIGCSTATDTQVLVAPSWALYIDKIDAVATINPTDRLAQSLFEALASKSNDERIVRMEV